MDQPQRATAERGAQPERTALSWSRLCLGALANGGLLLLRFAQPGRADPALAAAAVLLAGGLVVLAAHRSARLRRRPLPVPLAAERTVLAATGLVLLLGALALVGLLTG